MNKKARAVIFVAMLVAVAFIAIKSLAAPAQCNDRQDNDGDTLIDYPADPGCSSKQDNDETDPVTTTTSTSTSTSTTIADSCFDSDGGLAPFTFGNVTGYQSGSPYAHYDACNNSTVLTERVCSGTSPDFNFVDCVASNATCVSGRCVFI